jgi:hypothetical protein
MDTPPGQREYLPIAMMLKGQRLLDRPRDQVPGRAKRRKDKRALEDRMNPEAIKYLWVREQGKS